MSSMSFSIATNFNGALNITQFQNEIIANGTLSSNCIGINVSGDDVNLVFDNTLSPTEETTLTLLASAHVATFTLVEIARFTVNGTVTNTLPTSIGKYYLTNIGMPVYVVDVVSTMDIGATTYSISLFWRNTNTTMCSATYSNTSLTANRITSILSPQTTSPSVIDVIAYINSTVSGLKVAIYDIVLWAADFQSVLTG